ncbi:FecR family protein [Paraflavitalea pollutisoli]|uniref:FecR family protein n=1 Tax=Paraflavitalea pollutisoli TaxID=3034143 RepID=UPI0023ECBBF7|nr:FecR family protein [Paraflavitalea sp. H1-2-19X]
MIRTIAMPTTPIEQLLDKYLSGNLTEAERQQLELLLQDPAQQQLLADLLTHEMETGAFEARKDDQLLQQLQHHIQERIQSPAPLKKRWSFYGKRIAVAAVLLVAAGMAFWPWNQPANTPAAPTADAANVTPSSLQPGGQRAVLTLADGSEITLDSAHNGELAQQGAIKVIKLQDGRIRYDQQQIPTTEIVYNTIYTPRGGQYQVLLADGSKVWLNAASSLRYPVAFSGNERRVELKGEGYFEIAPDASKPFHVSVNNIDVTVLGTHFNINAYADEAAVRTTLLEGKVTVRGLTNPQATVTLQPGEQAIRHANDNISVSSNVDVEEVMAWKNGLFYFQSANLATILRQAARWYDVDIEFNHTVTQRFSGQISRNVNAAQLLSILESTGKVRFDIAGKTIKVQSP